MLSTQKLSSCGFQPYSYRDFTKQLRQLLQDRYTWDGDGFTILKELIQNANDAGATSLHLGWSPPLFDATSASNAPGHPSTSSSSQAPHPLLTVPALFAVNNGPLRASDAINITRLGSNSKAGEASSAGRFGLGLKSVFHLCEAFFYLAQPFEEHASLCSIFNPWSPPRGADEAGPYEHWDFDPDGSVAKSVEVAIHSRVAPLFAETSPSFCLWIPLRDERVLKGDALVKRYLSGFELGRILGETTLHVRLAELLPLLHGLREISVWIPNSKAVIERRFAVSVEPSATRPTKLPEPDGERLPPERQTNFSGRVIVSNFGNNAETACEFVGAEAIVIRDSIQELWRNKNWPSDESLDPVTNKWRDEPHRVKLIPHGALRFMATPKVKGTGKVSMHWCVFLPLGKSDGDEHLEVEAAIAADVSVFLHGYFFIDAGRTRHVKSELDATGSRHLDAESLQRTWNTTIEREAIWPQFLEALAAFVSQLKWDERQVEELTRAILAMLTRIAGNNTSSVLPIVCRAKQWLYLLKPPTESNRALGNWTLKTANAAVHDMPRPTASIALYDLLPGIAAVGSDRALTLAAWPRISASEATPWSSTALKKVVGSVVPSVLFKSNEHLEYFAQFLEHCANSEDQKLAVGEALWPLLKKAFQDDSLTLKRIEELGATLCSVLEFVPEEHRLVLNWASSERRGADAAFRLIANDECDLLPIPSSVRPTTGRDSKIIPSRIVVRILRTIENLSLDNSLLADVVGDLLKRADLDRETLWQSLNDVRLLVIHDCGQKQTTRKTCLELNDQKRRRLVFCDQAGLTQQLQAALGDAGVVWRIDPEFAAKVLGDKHGLPGCSARECAAVLAPPKHGDAVHFGGAALGAWEARRELLKRIAGTIGTGTNDDQDRLKDACRLLIHGRSQDAYVAAALFLAAEGRFDPLADTLARHVLANRHEEWRILAGELADWVVEEGLTPSQQKSLDMYPLAFSESAVLDLLEKANTDQLKGLDISKDEYAALLTSIDASRNDLLKKLPIHPVSGKKQRIAIPMDESVPVFWDDGYQLEDELSASITLLALDKRDLVSKRQLQLAPVLDRAEAVRRVLINPQREKYWLTILKAIEKSDERLPEDIVTDLRTKRWYPTRFGARVRDDLICFTLTGASGGAELPEDFRQEVTRLVEACKGAYVADWMLDEKLFKQLTESRKTVCQRLHDWGVLPDETQSLRQLGSLLAQDERNYCIGYVPRDHFDDWLAIDWDASVMPAYRLLKEVKERFGNERCFDHASEEVRNPITASNRLTAILNFLVDCHEHATTRDAKSRILRLFRKYLEFLLTHPDFNTNTMLTPLRLLSQADVWKQSAELCLPPVDGIARDNVLADDLAEMLRPWYATVSKPDGDSQRPTQLAEKQSRPIESQLEQSADVVTDYFRSWEGHVPNDVIGGFLALLGDDPRMVEVANRYLSKRSLDETRRNLRVSPSPFGRQHLRMSDQWFCVAVICGDSVEATNLLGQRFEAALTTNSGSLLVGFGEGRNVEAAQQGGRRLIQIQLRHIDMSTTHDPDVLSQLLSKAAHSLLAEAYDVPNESLSTQVDDVFADLRKSDQLEIRVTQQLILEDAELLLSQLGLQSDELLGSVIAKQTSFRRLRAERVHNEKRFGRPASWTESEIDSEQSETNNKLRSLLEDESSDGPRRILNAVRQRIQGHNQYNPASVPFELFQNADDACVERHQLRLNPIVAADTIDFFVSSRTLAVRHFGRCVNQVPPGCDPRQDKRSDDLRKMLTMWLSNKDAPSDEQSQLDLTGKFGLGFKSVFLVSDKPMLLSGQLACEIVGGVFPRYIDILERNCFDRYVGDLTLELKREVTVIELPLSRSDVDHDTGAHADVASIVGRFRDLAHLLVVFSQQIRRIEVVDQTTGETYKTEWHDQPVPGVTCCYKGTLQPLPDFLADTHSATPRSKEDVSARRVLVFRTSHRGALLLVHDGRQFKKLPKEVPNLWVTAPTQEPLDVGFALNALFSLDPGRARLGTESNENDDIAADLGRELGQRFVALFGRSKDWTRFCADIGLDSDANEYDFWDSLWELLGPGLARLPVESHADELIRRVFWDEHTGAARAFYSSCAALPNGLAGDFKCLTAIRDVRYELRDFLTDPRVLARVTTWDAWTRKQMSSAQCLVRDRVIQPLEKLGRLSGLSIEVVRLEHLLRCEADSASCILFERAAGIAKVLFDEPCVSKEADEMSEWKQLYPILECIRFPDRNGSPQLANQLLFGLLPQDVKDTSLVDEVRVAGFAPNDRVLGDQFLTGESARLVLRLIRKCRGQHELKTRQIGEWAIDATGAAAKKAVEHYLATGARRDSLIELLRTDDDQLRRSWLAGLHGKPILQTAIEREAAISQTNETYSRREARVTQSDQILRRVHDWWMKEGGKQLLITRKYRLFDPIEHGPLRADFDRDDIEQRKAWMRLFLLGISHTLGRTSASQDAGFIFDFCEDRGWVDVFVEPDGDPDRWIRILRDFLEPEIDTSQYLHWMRQFVAIFAMAERLDDYIESFLSIERRTSRFALTAITCPRTSYEAPVDAPPIARVLGMGACFIVRELLRLGILTNQLAWEHAFVPRGKVRGALQELGCEFSSGDGRSWEWSRGAWQFVESGLGSADAATFDLDFDLPFQVLAHRDNADKRSELFDGDWDYDDSEDNQDGLF